MVKVSLEPPAVAVALPNVLVTASVTSSTMATLSEPVAGPAKSSASAEAVLGTAGSASVVVSTL